MKYNAPDRLSLSRVGDPHLEIMWLGISDLLSADFESLTCGPTGWRVHVIVTQVRGSQSRFHAIRLPVVSSFPQSTPWSSHPIYPFQVDSRPRLGFFPRPMMWVSLEWSANRPISPCVLWKAQWPHDVVRTITTTPSSRCLGTDPSDTTFKTSLRYWILLSLRFPVYSHANATYSYVNLM